MHTYAISMYSRSITKCRAEPLPKMNRVGRITTVLCVLVYESTAISGYLLFGQSTDSDILSNFDKDLEIPFSSILITLLGLDMFFI